MNKLSIQAMVLAVCISFSASLAKAIEDAATRTCPCAQVPYISLDTSVKKVVKAFKKSSPRGQRSQLEGFINQYVYDPHEVNEEVLVTCARIYAERMNNQKVYQLVQDLIHAKIKKPAQKKALLAIGKILKSSKEQYCPVRSMPQDEVEAFKQALPMQQRILLLQYAERYASNSSDYLETMLVECAHVYCERVQSQTLNKLVKELITAYDKAPVVLKIKQSLSLR